MTQSYRNTTTSVKMTESTGTQIPRRTWLIHFGATIFWKNILQSPRNVQALTHPSDIMQLTTKALLSRLEQSSVTRLFWGLCPLSVFFRGMLQTLVITFPSRLHEVWINTLVSNIRKTNSKLDTVKLDKNKVLGQRKERRQRTVLSWPSMVSRKILCYHIYGVISKYRTKLCSVH